MRYEVLVFNHRVVSTKFTRMGQRAANASPAFNQVADYLMDATAKQFESQGRRSGGSWKRLTPKWLFRKTRAGHDGRILHMTGALRRSVTKKGAKGQVLVITPRSVTLGSRLPYAARHQFGFAQTPARPFLRVTPTDRERMRNVIRDHLIGIWRVGGRRV